MSLYSQIYKIVAAIPPGKIVTYGDVARAAGLFRGAQVVGWALRHLPLDTDIPWQRVVAKGGRITIVNPRLTKNEQIRRLKDEGLSVIERDGWYVVENADAWWELPEQLSA